MLTMTMGTGLSTTLFSVSNDTHYGAIGVNAGTMTLKNAVVCGVDQSSRHFIASLHRQIDNQHRECGVRAVKAVATLKLRPMTIR